MTSANLPFMLWTRPATYQPLAERRSAHVDTTPPLALPMTVAAPVVKLRAYVPMTIGCERCCKDVVMLVPSSTKARTEAAAKANPFICIACTRTEQRRTSEGVTR